MEQRSPEWYAIRLGKVTASRVSDVTSKTKTGYSTSRQNYAAELIVERLTGRQGDFFQTAAMAWGTNTEPMARSAYEARMGVLVEEVGFVPHPNIEMAGASPDGLIGEEGLVEIKCPNTSTHIEILLSKTVPLKYLYQMQWQMACTGALWCDFVSYDPRMPEGMQLFIERWERSDDTIMDLEREVEKFLSEIDEKISKLTCVYQKENE